jgi:hypothetical protein
MRKFLFFLAYLPFFNPEVSAQNQSEIESQIFNFYVLFGSECCGIDQKAFLALHQNIQKFQKKHKSKIAYETLYWGKEGEKVVYIDLAQLSDNQSIVFFQETLGILRNKAYKLVKVSPLLEYHRASQTLWVHCIPYGINQKREQGFLAFIEQFEAENQVKILKGAMINETHWEKDQDKRFELNLNLLSPAQQNDLIKQIKAIFAVPIYPKTH